jgi:hypothetical protein
MKMDCVFLTVMSLSIITFPLELAGAKSPPTHFQKKLPANFADCLYSHHVEVGNGCMQLINRLLICDELGGVTSRTFEVVQGNVLARKIFELDSAEVEAAELVIRAEGGKLLLVEVNGHTIEHRTTKENVSFQGHVDSYWSTGWEIVPVPVEYLREGRNQVVLRDGGDEGWRLYIDNGFGLNRSAKSIDRGNTWTTYPLGWNNFCRGEYVVRLNLKRHAPSGWIESPSVDLFAEGGGIAPRAEVKGFTLDVDADCPEGTSIEILWRSGETPTYRPDTWEHWHRFEKANEPDQDAQTQPGNTSDVRRFFQWRAVLKTENPTYTPMLRNVYINAEVEILQWGNAKVVDIRNEKIVFPSFTFAHQLADEPRLKILRERWRLGHVIEGGKTEFEKILRLKRWVRHQWENGWDRGALQYVPPWDAMVVLELAGQKLSLGMCTHYSSTFAQCCLAVGIPARVTIISCHCVAEVWSNEYKKWVMMDPGCDTDDGRKGTRHFERNGIPMSALELHQAYVNDDYDGIVEINDPEKFGGDLRENIGLYRQFCATRRNNFLTSLLPEESEHGAVSYTYDGHLWYRSEAQPLPQFSQTSRREGDFHWTLNQTVVHLQQGKTPDTLNVLLDTVTPNFETYLVQFGDDEWEEKPEAFVWSLHEGKNILRAKSQNSFGILGIESVVAVEAR